MLVDRIGAYRDLGDEVRMRVIGAILPLRTQVKTAANCEPKSKSDETCIFPIDTNVLV